MKTFILTASLLASGFALQAQNPLSTDLKQNWKERKTLLLAEAGRMSDADYSFQATPKTATFAARIAHVADGQMMICSAIKGESKRGDAASKTSKADLVAALKASFDYCDPVYNGMTDAAATQQVKVFGQSESKLTALWDNISHDDEMYGYMAVYLRLKGLVPPSSDPHK